MVEPGSYRMGTFSRDVLMLQQLFEAATRATASDDGQ